MNQFNKILKFEFLNVFRNKWIIAYGVLLAALTFALIMVGGSFSKAVLSIANIIVVLVPLVSLIFTVVYWYYNEKYTELLLTQPLSRTSLFAARLISVCGTLGISAGLGIFIPFLFYRGISAGVLLNIIVAIGLTIIFVALGLLIGILFVDRMKGIGFALSVWLFFVIVYDGIILLLLLALREYPLDLISGFLGVLNPIGLSRVVLLMYHEGSLLLGYTGTLVRRLLTTEAGYFVSAAVTLIWISWPILFGKILFKKRDF